MAISIFMMYRRNGGSFELVTVFQGVCIAMLWPYYKVIIDTQVSETNTVDFLHGTCLCHCALARIGGRSCMLVPLPTLYPEI